MVWQTRLLGGKCNKSTKSMLPICDARPYIMYASSGEYNTKQNKQTHKNKNKTKQNKTTIITKTKQKTNKQTKKNKNKKHKTKHKQTNK